MADINYTYADNEHQLTTYDDVIIAYNWITDAIKSVYSDGEIGFSINFQSGNLSYSCRGLEEFKKHAFGKDIVFNNMYISAGQKLNWGLISVFANSKKEGSQEYIISSKDEMLISDLVDALRSEKRNDTTQAREVIVNYEDNSIHIGSGNSISETIIGNNNSISNKKCDDSKEKWYSKIAWNIVVPIFVGVIILIIGACLGLDG